MSPLDNPAWHALTGPHAALAEVAGGARRYPPDVSVFAAVDRLDAAGWSDLAALAGPGGFTVLARPSIPAPPEGWAELLRLTGFQMVLAGPPRGDARPPPGAATLRPLTEADVPAMLALVELTRPGPFLPGTIALGGYVGVEEGGRLVAMAGRRMHPPGFTEVSGVCTHPEAAGRGLATAVTAHVAREVRAEGDTPILHVAQDNDAARRVYERLGFAVRTTMEFAALTVPGEPDGQPGGVPPATSAASRSA